MVKRNNYNYFSGKYTYVCVSEARNETGVYIPFYNKLNLIRLVRIWLT